MSIKNGLITLVGKVPFGLRSRVKNIPGLKQLQSFLLKKYASNASFEATISGGPAKGLVFPVQMPQDKLMWIGTWELDFALALQKAVQPGFVCFDIGGYKGYYAGVMALKSAKAVYVFEPMPANAVMIKKLIELNPDLPIHLKQAAVSDNDGETIFKLMKEETMGKLASSIFQPSEQELVQVKVDCITLDSLVKAGIPDPDFIKIDVEGAEELVLKGGLALLERKRPYLMIEIHSPEIGKRCLHILEKLYSTILVFETGQSPDKGTPEICHYIAYN